MFACLNKYYSLFLNNLQLQNTKKKKKLFVKTKSLPQIKTLVKQKLFFRKNLIAKIGQLK